MANQEGLNPVSICLATCSYCPPNFGGSGLTSATIAGQSAEANSLGSARLRRELSCVEAADEVHRKCVKSNERAEIGIGSKDLPLAEVLPELRRK